MQATDFEILAAPETIRPFVRRCMYANRTLEAPLIMRPKPTGYIYFSNGFVLSAGSLSGGGFEAIVDGAMTRSDSRWYFAGQIVDHDIEVHIRDHLGVVFCELAATAVHRLFGLPGVSLTGKALPLRVAGGQFVTLAGRCFTSGTENSPEGHLAEVETFFTALAKRAGPGDPAVEKAVALFEAANGAVKVADVCKEIGIGQRQLARRFNHIVGVSPKFFGQILQINWVVGLLYFNDAATLTEIAHDAGFYDQAHFNHAMQRFFSEGPSEFLKSEHVAFKTFLGASRRYGPASAGPG
jgi:AraC-like DNA-binding protein